MIEKLNSLSLPKEFNYADSNEDFQYFNLMPPIHSYALSDGASNSYNSKLWAQILVKSFTKEQTNISENWLLSCIKSYISRHDFATMSWLQTEGFEKGSFATFVGIQQIILNAKPQKRFYRFFLIGDSFIFLFKKNYLGNYRYKPLFDIPNFNEDPYLVSSNIEWNKKLDFNNLGSSRLKEVKFYKKDRMIAICATDALAAWISKVIENQIIKEDLLCRFLISVTEEQFKLFVIFCRILKVMNIDDTTFAVLRL